MRADRLVAVLMMLQGKGTVTAAEVADELEVSVRTARRDLDALAMSGVPIYSQPGRGGGWRLIGGATTDLTGLTGPEARALFRVAGPSTSLNPELRAALRKLVQAIPEPFREDAEHAAGAVISDPTSWSDRADRTLPGHLDDLEAAVLDRRRIKLIYDTPDRSATGGPPLRSEREVDPLGLIEKRGVWYLVAGTDRGQRTFRVSRVVSVRVLDDVVVVPDDFDLEKAWNEVTTRLQGSRPTIVVRGRIRPDFLPILRSLSLIGDIDVQPARGDWVPVEIMLRDVETAVGVLAGFGAALDIDSPENVRVGLRRVGEELLERYASV